MLYSQIKSSKFNCLFNEPAHLSFNILGYANKKVHPLKNVASLLHYQLLPLFNLASEMKQFQKKTFRVFITFQGCSLLSGRHVAMYWWVWSTDTPLTIPRVLDNGFDTCGRQKSVKPGQRILKRLCNMIQPRTGDFTLIFISYALLYEADEICWLVFRMYSKPSFLHETAFN